MPTNKQELFLRTFKVPIHCEKIINLNLDRFGKNKT